MYTERRSFAFPALRTFPWQMETNGVRHAQQWIEDSVRNCKHANVSVSGKTINDWICNRLPADHPAAEILLDPPRLDAWGNPHQVQSRETLDEIPRVYSTGEDGLANSNGNAPDDIRSWDEKRWRWYSRRQFTREISFCMIVSALIAAVGFWLFAHQPKSRSGATQSCG